MLRPSAERPDTDQDGGKIRKVGGVEDLGVLFKVKGQGPGDGGFKALYPLKVSASLEGKIVQGFQATVRSDGQLKVVCSGQKQYESALKVDKLVRAEIEAVGMVRRGRGLTGVIYEVDAGLTDKEVMENVRSRQVTGLVRFRPKEGGGGDSPVLRFFGDGALPERVNIGSMSYRVREYIRPPLRCYKCQKFGHSAGAC